MNSIREQFGRRKVIALVSICIVTFSLIYVFVQTRSGLAILTAPPPGIPGPYYVTAEAKTYGPVVDLAAIKSKMGGEYSSDYNYVQWGTNPFCRVYVDNTLQEVYYGQMVDVMDIFSNNFQIEKNLRDTYDTLKNVGALDPTSILGKLCYFGNMPGKCVAYYVKYTNWGGSFSHDFTMNTTSCYAVEAALRYSGGSSTQGTMTVQVNGSTCLYLAGTNYSYDGKAIKTSGLTGTTLNWKVKGTGANYGIYSFAVTVYSKDILGLEATFPGNIKNYTVIGSPGTGFVSKYVSPSSPVAGSAINVTVRLDPLSANNMNITDSYLNTFAWGSVDVLLEKFRIGIGLEDSVYVNVVPVPDGSNMTFTVYYNQAPSILQSLESDEYIYLTYSLRVPDVAGEYTLPSATMSYLIPTPET